MIGFLFLLHDILELIFVTFPSVSFCFLPIWLNDIPMTENTTCGLKCMSLQNKIKNCIHLKKMLQVQKNTCSVRVLASS